MSVQTIVEATELFVQPCCSCGVLFAMPVDLDKRYRHNKRSFYCPNGHSQSYMGESDDAKIKRLEREVANAEEQARLEHAAANRATSEAKRLRLDATKAKRRAAAGVCPCCQRSFVQMSRHLASKHPEFVEQAK